MVAGIQEVLQRLQRTPQSWMLARELLSRPSEKVRFFGALTLIVKLNTDRYIVPTPGLWQARSASQASPVLMDDGRSL